MNTLSILQTQTLQMSTLFQSILLISKTYSMKYITFLKRQRILHRPTYDTPARQTEYKGNICYIYTKHKHLTVCQVSLQHANIANVRQHVITKCCNNEVILHNFTTK